MSELEARPYASSLIESMRSVGYSLESAIADLIDNSISANANSVRIEFRPFDEPYLAIIDNGGGMSPDELTDAMRHGSKNPANERKAGDLGRFGLGLKTASLSQCKKLTVISLKDGNLSCRCWDLDHVALRNDWILLVPDSEEEIRALPHVMELVEAGHGTIVLLQSLDRLIAGESTAETAFRYKMEQVRQHLALVFHRFLTGEQGLSRIGISINGEAVDPVDPYLSSNRATQVLPESQFQIENGTITVRPFILPHASKLSAEELKRAGGEESLRKYQGFYVYRGCRLIIWGTWFRLRRQEELSKLARVRVDLPNSLDHLWTLDIKKSTAHPPEIIRTRLKTIVDRIADRSRSTYTYRGRKTGQAGMTPAWNRIEGRGASFSYRINREHPLVRALHDSLDNEQARLLDGVLGLLEQAFPCDSLYADMASDLKQEHKDFDFDTLKDMALQIIDAMVASVPNGKDTALQTLPQLEPFSHTPELTARIIKELENAV